MPLVLPLITTFAPSLLRWLFGPKASTTASAVGAVVQAVTGHDASTAEGVAGALAAAAGDPDKALALRVQLQQLADDATAAERKADLDSLTAQLGDVASARSMTVAMAAAHSAVEWAAPVVSVVVTVGFFFVLWLLLTGKTSDLAPAQAAIVNMVIGTLATGFATVIAFWLGSSAGSAGKDRTIASAQVALANSTPPSPAS
jgi:hypothetical protein